MARRSLLLLLALALLATFAACDDVTPMISGTPTPSVSPSPTPAAFTASVAGAAPQTDLLGKELTGEDHYFQYLSFGAMRVYEYGTGTFLDGVCVNGYPLPLDGKVNLVYYNADGKLCGVGTIQNAEGTTVLKSGSNRIYAEIQTDVNVQTMDFALEIKTAFQPVEE